VGRAQKAQMVASVHYLTLAGNVSDFVHTGIFIVNPWAEP
jgi:hypothetical protein